jgi:hypothetical protein
MSKSRMLLAAAAVVGGLVLPVAGCGNHTTATQPGVATLRSAAPSAARVSANGSNDPRPVMRPDISDAEIIALQNAWAGCLADHGVPATPLTNAGAERKTTVDLSLPKYATARAACADKEPEDWRDVEARTDPQYADRLRAELQCLVDQGIKGELRGDPPQIVFTDDRQVSRGLELSPACEQKAFGDVMKAFNGR